MSLSQCAETGVEREVPIRRLGDAEMSIGSGEEGDIEVELSLGEEGTAEVDLSSGDEAEGTAGGEMDAEGNVKEEAGDDDDDVVVVSAREIGRQIIVSASIANVTAECHVPRQQMRRERLAREEMVHQIAHERRLAHLAREEQRLAERGMRIREEGWRQADRRWAASLPRVNPWSGIQRPAPMPPHQNTPRMAGNVPRGPAAWIAKRAERGTRGGARESR